MSLRRHMRVLFQNRAVPSVADRILRTRRIHSRRPATSVALVNAQHELAFRKRRLKDQGKTKG
jgi:hypothetical protein